MSKRKTKISIGTERGQSATELALVLPILMLILLAIMQFGIVFRDYLTLTDAVRAGTRKGAVARHLATPSTYTENEVKKAATDLGASLEVKADSSWLPGEDLVVTASYPYSINLLGLVVKSGRMSSKTTERVE